MLTVHNNKVIGILPNSSNLCHNLATHVMASSEDDASSNATICDPQTSTDVANETCYASAFESVGDNADSLADYHLFSHLISLFLSANSARFHCLRSEDNAAAESGSRESK